MLNNLKKSIFINIIASFFYIEFFLIILIPVFGVLTYLTKVFPLTLCIFFPIYSVPLFFVCLIGFFIELKNLKLNGFLIDIPDKITNSLCYKIIFYTGLTLSLIQIILSTILVINFCIYLSYLILTN